ncbi:MAG: site-2 protease family protein [Candidatus Alkanophagales archaeon]
MKTSLQLVRIMGIPVKLHVTFLMVLPLFAWLFAQQPRPFGFAEIGDVLLRYSVAAAATVLLFTSVLLHELSHSAVAMRYGARINSIVLFIFGGIAMMEEIPREPGREARVAFAGPAASFAIGGVCLALYYLTDIGSLPLELLVLNVGYLNVALAAFNLIPAFPMDGGRILRAALARKHSFLAATKKAAFVGKAFAIAMALAGVLNPWLILIAFIIYVGASEEEAATLLHAALEGLKVKHVMSAEVPEAVPPELSLTELVDLMFWGRRLGYLVADEGGVCGFVSFADVSRVPVGHRPFLKVRDVMTPLPRISEDEDAINALREMLRHNTSRLAVFGEGGFKGIIRKADILKFVELASAAAGGRSTNEGEGDGGG